MKYTFIRILLLASIVFLMSGCVDIPFYHHQLMVGQIVQINEEQVVICLGSSSGADIGQELWVYRIVSKESVAEEEFSWMLERTGKVRIDSILNQHFARVKVVKGSVLKGDVVELEPSY